MKLGLAALVLLGVAGLMAYMRLAPDDVARWHVALVPLAGAAAPGVSEVPGGAVCCQRLTPGSPSPAAVGEGVGG